MNNLFKINGITIITGAAGLLGEQHARAVLEFGGSVALLDINQNKLEILKQKLVEDGYENVLIFKCDITDKTMVDDVLLEIEKTDHKIIGLINNAAINPVVNKNLSNSNELETFDLKN